jgi:5-formyltetrahydrofolate cyclo-ligase
VAAPETKDELRARLTAARRRRSDGDLAAARAAVRDHVVAGLGDLTCVAAYEPLRTEPGSIELLAALHGRGLRVLVPLTLPDRDLDWTEWTPGGAGAPLGRDAVAAAELVLVPALAVGVDGARLGRGGGSYDRALPRRAAGAMTAALVFADEVLDAVPIEPWDVSVSHAVTPDGWRTLDRNTAVGGPR